MFPVQRVAKIEASRAAAVFFFQFFFFHENIVNFFLKKEKKRKKKSPVAPFLASRPVYRKKNYFYGQPSSCWYWVTLVCIGRASGILTRQVEDEAKF